MDKIDEGKYNEAEKIKDNEKPNKNKKFVITAKNIEKNLIEMENPTLAQKKLAVKLKLFLDKRINEELSKKGMLSDSTRRWVNSYNSILEKIQKAMNEDKGVNINLHTVSHSDIAAKLREASKKKK